MFLRGMSRISRPPSPVSAYSHFRLIVGGAVELQINSRMILTKACSISFGIPCAFVRNWVMPPVNICNTCFLAVRAMFPLSQVCRVFLTLSRMGFQGADSFTLLPIQAPRHLTACPSLAIQMDWGRGWSVGWMHLVFITQVLWAGQPIGITSVFSTLNFAPEARHHLDRMCCRSA